MRYQLVTGPSIEPVTLAEAQLFARIDESADSSLVNNLISTARQMVEQYTNRQLITQTWDIWYDTQDRPFITQFAFDGANYSPTAFYPITSSRPEDRRLLLPVAPVQSITSFNSYDSENNETLFDASNYMLSGSYITLKDFCYWPILLRQYDSIYIRVVSAYGDYESNVPFPLKQAMLMLISHWYENRGALMDPMNNSGAQLLNMPFSVTALVAPYRKFAM